jgi:putative transposase
MAVSKMELLELVSKAEAGDVDFLREGVRVLAQALMEAEVSAQIGAEHGQRVPDRVTHRNGYRARDPEAASGQLPAVDAGTTPAG